MDAVVLAGGTEPGAGFGLTGVRYRPLLEVAGGPIIGQVLGALGGAASVDRVSLVAPAPVLQVADELTVDFRVSAGDSFLENLLLGIESLPDDHKTGTGHVLVITGDLPLVTAAAVEDFVERSRAADADLTYPIIPRAFCEREFPGGRRTYVRLREGTFTGGNAVVMTRAFAARSRELIGRLYAYRKRPVKLATLFGPGFILGLLLGRLSISALEQRASAIVAGRARAIVTEYAELGFDVDKPEDLAVAQAAAARRQRGLRGAM